MANTETRCGHWIGRERRYCHSTENVRRYLTGPCCPQHTPSAVAGVPEAPEKPQVTAP